MLPLRRWGQILQAAMKRQQRHSHVSHFPGASSRLAGLHLLLGRCSPGADLDTHVVAAQWGHTWTVR